MESLVYFLAGVCLSWLISYYYYNKSDKEKPEWFGVDTIKDILSKNP